MENIALSFSGGGFRAAAYSLGCLSYLQRVKVNDTPLLHKVRYISSTSGGSITNLLYSSYLYNGKSFDQFYDDLDQMLEGEKLLADALGILKDQSKWENRPHKSVNIINAFSLAYDQLFKGEIFNIYNDPNSLNPHLEEICVNATEFTNGQAFRFQSQHSHKKISKGLIGNHYIFFNRSGIGSAIKLKLADILASSSCFPGGFEPMIFPKDYTHQTLTAAELDKAITYKANSFTVAPYNSIDFLKNPNFGKQIGLMDGGIADNQGIDAFIRADERRKNSFDLFLSCDVTSYFMDGFTLPVHKRKWYDFISLRIILVLSGLAALWLPAMFFIFSKPWLPWQYITGTISGILLLLMILLFAVPLLRNLGNKNKGTWKVTFNKYRKIFLGLSLGDLRQMVASRLKSVFMLSEDIYLKQIRRMYYSQIFADPKYNKRVIQNTIYDLSRVKFPSGQGSGKPLQPSQLMVTTAEKARTMGTTLWFDANHTRDDIKRCIIATGQFTTCYNLLRFIQKMPETDRLRHASLEAALVADFNEFNTNPFFMM